MWERDTIRKNFANPLATCDLHVVLTSLNAAISGDVSYDSGTQEQTITPVKKPSAPIHEGQPPRPRAAAEIRQPANS